MISILRMNPSGTDGIRTIMTFEFIIDSTNDLPKDEIITLGERIYVVANNSIAINSKNNFTYSFNNGKWIKTNTKTTPSDNTITSNGNYTIPSSTVTGTGNVDVNIKSKVVTLVDKEITKNGTYLPAEDEATAYSKVVVDVPPPSNEFYPSIKTQSLMAQNYTGNTWLPKTWNVSESFSGVDIWTDGDNIYLSSGPSQYVLNKSTSTWSPKTWNGLTSFRGGYIWTDGDNIYCANFSNHYILDKSTSTWSPKTWNGLTSFTGSSIWTDGYNIYCSKQTGQDSYEQYVLDKSTSTWSVKTWSGFTSINGSYVWTDGDNIYHSYGSNHYYLPITKKSFSVPFIKPQS